MALCASLPLLALAPTPLALGAALLLYGAITGALDVSMNSAGVAVEGLYGRPIMPSLHALFSFGGLAGAASGGFAASRGLDPLPHFLLVAVPLGALSAGVGRALLPRRFDARAAGPAFARPTRPLLALGAVAFCALLAEGAMADWGAVYLRDTLGADAGFAAAGYAAFSLTMALGRLAGDRLAVLLGPARLVRLGGSVAALGLALALLTGEVTVAILGFAAVGAGLAAVFPLVLSAAARAPGTSPGPAIAAMSTVGYLGFLVGPPALGFVAASATLAVALGLVVGLGALIALLGGSVRPASAGGHP